MRMSECDDVLRRFDVRARDKEAEEAAAGILKKTEENLRPEVLRLLYSCMDITSLNTEDTKEKIRELVNGVNNFGAENPDLENVAAVCVYPNFVWTVKKALRAPGVRVASVSGGFPSSHTFLKVKLAEVALAAVDGADEIDIVLPLGAFFQENHEELTDEIKEIKEVCRGARLKVILETGLLKTASRIKKASVLAMYAGADFIKTSTGKVYPGAGPQAVYLMCETIKEYYRLYNKKIGIKVSGGVRTAAQAVEYYTLVKETLGEQWLTPEYFRIGASSLAGNILDTLTTLKGERI
jgi:deoxyribose-phosphate aldolase